LDRRFLKYGLTVQEASVLLRCVEARRSTPGQLAVSLGRDKGNITKFVDRLEAGGLITRDIRPRDRRVSVLNATAKGKRVARDLACVFDIIRKELFVGIPENDVRRVSQMLSELHKNVTRIEVRNRCDAKRRRRRIGVHVSRRVGHDASVTVIVEENREEKMDTEETLALHGSS